MTETTDSTFSRYDVPDAAGHYGEYGGMYVPETLYTPLKEVEAAFNEAWEDPEFQKDYLYYLKEYAGRPTNLYYADNLSQELGGAKVYFKREDLLHTGAHKINNVVGQVLLAKRMGKKRIIAETGAGQHGVATATVCAKFGLECIVYMGAVDMERQALNVFRMRLCGAKVVGVTSGQKTLKDAVNEAMRDWVTNVRSSHYILGSALGAHPYPMMVRQFHKIIGEEAKKQILEKEGRLPHEVVACVGGGSNAIGLFFDFLEEPDVRLVGVEAGGHGIQQGQHAARFAGGKVGVLQGTKTFLLQNPDGQIELTHSISAGLDYAAIGPEHSYYRDLGRIEFAYATDEQVLDAFKHLCKSEGIIPALESTHAIAYALTRAKEMSPDEILLVNLSGRGDKDVQSVAQHLGDLAE